MPHFYFILRCTQTKLQRENKQWSKTIAGLELSTPSLCYSLIIRIYSILLIDSDKSFYVCSAWGIVSGLLSPEELKLCRRKQIVQTAPSLRLIYSSYIWLSKMPGNIIHEQTHNTDYWKEIRPDSSRVCYCGFATPRFREWITLPGRLAISVRAFYPLDRWLASAVDFSDRREAKGLFGCNMEASFSS